MKKYADEPAIAVGLMTGVREARFLLDGVFADPSGLRVHPGQYRAIEDGGDVCLRDQQGQQVVRAQSIKLVPANPPSDAFTVADMTIGIDFHWQRREEQIFQGTLKILSRAGQGLVVINHVPLEVYVRCVVASEMSASCPIELLKAHAIISRSWLLAQLDGGKPDARISNHEPRVRSHEIIRWYDRKSHNDFDVCADDHCQRYQGISKVSASVHDAVEATRGMVLVHEDEICDTRFSKCCGGMTDDYRVAWEDVNVPYLAGIYDGPQWPAEFKMALTEETAASYWIAGSPPAYCNTSDHTLIGEILPGFDQETRDFFRWEVGHEQDELRSLVERKLNLELGSILRLEPIERGVSGRIIRLRIAAEKADVVIGKELEIRRALSPSHLYSSAFVVHPEGKGRVPERFRLIGAGWGHGVGLCQIGAAVMAKEGELHKDILAHYYRGSGLQRLYGRAGHDA